jgi:hypothetical protein
VNVDKTKRERLERKGWTVGTAEAFLGLPPEETAYVELKLALSRSVRDYRRAKRLTQVEVANRMRSSQSRVAKLETGDASVSIDLLIRSLLVMGATRDELAKIIASGKPA